MNKNTQAATHIAADEPTHLSQDKTIPGAPIKIAGKDTPVILRKFSKQRRNCPFNHGEMCLSNVEVPHRCVVPLCPCFQMPLKQAATFLEMIEDGH